ncbi:uncharacterized protein LOC127136624 [Lathyrus oleraceus]|uniref:uncharacterized protein LOC127136624 n=1 Tax=Pisum sativum TaxID=3888 RepID=UPI0021D307EE|nr:uncharacterized protein LOC127136624 [Pisum sativum]
MDQSLYRSMIGSLLYLTTSRPDITFVVGNANSLLIGYCDADWEGNVDDRKSTLEDRNIHVLISHVLGIEPKTGVVSDVSTSLAQPDNTTETRLDKFDVNVSTQSYEKSEDKEDSDGKSSYLADKEENSIEKKDQSPDIVNINDLDSDDEPIGKRLAPRISKSKVVTPVSKKKSLKRKEAPSESSESDHDVEHNVQDIISSTRKQASGKKIPTNIPEVPIDNISFHYVDNVEKWKLVYQRRLALERELGKDDFECKKLMSLIQEAGLMKIVTGFGKCYEMLVKEFIMNISKECDNKRSKKFRKVYVRGMCVDFSPEIIIRFLGRNEEGRAEVEVSDNVICREITAKQVKE